MDQRFVRLWAATGVSNLGDGLRIAALPLLATRLTDDPRLIAGVAIAERLPWLAFVLPGGALADRFDRRQLRVGLDAVRAVVMGSLALLVATGHVSMPAIYATAALLASAEAIVDSSSTAMVPALVDEVDLERAGSRMSTTEILANAFIGPPVGALLFGLVLAAPFALDAASFAVAALLVSSIAGRFRPEPPTTSPQSMRADVMEGLRWLWRHRTLRSLALVSFGLGFAAFVSGSVYVIFATKTLGLGEAQYGLLLLPPAVGALAGAALAPRIGRLGSLRVILSLIPIAAGLTHFVVAATSVIPLIAVMWAISDGMPQIWNVLTIALRQREIPDHLLGRVGASYRMLVYLGMPFGALTGGLITSAVGVRSAIACAGVILIAMGAVVAVLLRPTADLRSSLAPVEPS